MMSKTDVYFCFSAFLLYTLQVAMNFAMMSALYGDFMQVGLCEDKDWALNNECT